MGRLYCPNGLATLFSLLVNALEKAGSFSMHLPGFMLLLRMRNSVIDRVTYLQQNSIDLSLLISKSHPGAKKRLPPLRNRLVALRSKHEIVDTIEINDHNTPILKYATRLAEKVSQKSVDPSTQLTLEFYLADYSEKYSTVAVISTTLKLHDVYTWETSGATVTSENVEEIEYVGNDNFIDYFRQLLKFCLDKEIHADVEAFAG
ncbi:unnamed protein product [Hymenolepis diminuta]|uniref:DUF727 domain-containing protein n=1 Tax=Hymenolepis diminuta TaxID=6216 RepID=A0A0R3S9A3_HYMDI|nr:unnamed protein product [Hymenolepis diminuta]